MRNPVIRGNVLVPELAGERRAGQVAGVACAKRWLPCETDIGLGKRQWLVTSG